MTPDGEGVFNETSQPTHLCIFGTHINQGSLAPPRSMKNQRQGLRVPIGRGGLFSYCAAAACWIRILTALTLHSFSTAGASVPGHHHHMPQPLQSSPPALIVGGPLPHYHDEAMILRRRSCANKFQSRDGNKGNMLLHQFRGGATTSFVLASKRATTSTYSTIRRHQSLVATIQRGGGANTNTKTNNAASTAGPPLLETHWRQQLTLGLVFMALFNDTLQVTMLLPMIPTLVASPPPLGVSPQYAQVAMGLFFASKDICQLAMAPLAGIWTARTSPTMALLGSTIGLGVATLVFADATSFRQLMVARGCQGAASAATLCGGLSLVAETQDPQNRGSAMGIAYTGLALGLLCGPLIGGFMLDRLGRRSTFRVAAVMVLANAMAQVLAILVTPKKPPSTTAIIRQEQGTAKQLSSSKATTSATSATSSWRAFRTLLSNSDVLTVTLSTVAIHAVLGAIKPMSQIVLEQEFGMSIVNRSLTITIATLMFFVTAPLAGRLSDHMPRSKLIATSLGFMSLSTLFFGLRTSTRRGSLVLFNISVALLGTALGLNGAAGQALLADLVDRHELGPYSMAFALSDVSDSLGLILGSVIGLSLSQRFGSRVGAGVLGLCCVLLLPRVWKIR
jgi:DHA1 family solute carrier family 18 vesicular amine transporter 1/2